MRGLNLGHAFVPAFVSSRTPEPARTGNLFSQREFG